MTGGCFFGFDFDIGFSACVKDERR